MGRAGSSGGGRSSSGGGSRSSGGRSGGRGSPSRNSSSGFSSSSSSSRSRSSSSFGSSGGGFSTPRFSPPPRPMYYNSRPNYTSINIGGRGGYSSGGNVYHTTRNYNSSRTGSTVLRVFIGIALVFLMLLVFSALFSLNSDSNITRSTIVREPLAASALIETDYYTDELGWISSSTKLKTGMKNFKDLTGVQPYLYITDNINGKSHPTDSEIDAWANAMYDQLFRDEAHIFVLFLENNDSYKTWYVCGSQAKTVIDDEAADILLDYIDRYYYDSMDDDAYFAKSFDSAAKRIMKVEKSPWPGIVFTFAVALLLIILFRIWKARTAQKNLEAEQMQRILETPVEQISSDSDPLSKKYDEI